MGGLDRIGRGSEQQRGPKRSRESREVRRGAPKWLDKLLESLDGNGENKGLLDFLGRLFGKSSSPSKSKDVEAKQRAIDVLGEDMSDALDFNFEITEKVQKKIDVGVPKVKSVFPEGSEWRAALDDACQIYGVAPETVTAIMFMENPPFNPRAVNPDPNSKATGLGQHTQGTWRSIVDYHNERFPGKKFDKQADRLNPIAQIYLTVALTRSNADSMNLDASDPSNAMFLYLAHHDGEAEAKNILAFFKSGGQTKFDIKNTYWKKTKGGIYIDSHWDYVRFVCGYMATGTAEIARELEEDQYFD